MKLELTAWFEVAKHGLPHRPGLYEFELWFNGKNGRFIQLHTMAIYRDRFVYTGGRKIEVTRMDCWRGIRRELRAVA